MKPSSIAGRSTVSRAAAPCVLRYLVKRCANFKDRAKCKVCPKGEYAEFWNTYLSCAPCKPCLKENGVEYKKECNDKSNAECKCRPGYSLVPVTSFEEKCIKFCGKGEQLKPGDSNTCEPCRPGFYSDRKGIESCKPWTDCEAEGQHLIKNGSRTEDTECSLSTPTRKSTTATEGSSVPPSVTVSASATTAGKPAIAEETKFLIGVIIVAAVLFVIVLIKKRIMHFGLINRDFHWCFGFIQHTKAPIPVQEEVVDVLSEQVKN